MPTLKLTRVAYTKTETQGILSADGREYQTIERPWMKDPFHQGGLSFESCIPDGTYKLKKHTRPDGTKTVALINPKLGVWYQKDDRPDDWGRYLILIHSANYVHQVVGCIAPGLSRTIYNNRLMVGSSRAAMRKLNPRKYDRIEIKTTKGTR